MIRVCFPQCVLCSIHDDSAAVGSTANCIDICCLLFHYSQRYVFFSLLPYPGGPMTEEFDLYDGTVAYRYRDDSLIRPAAVRSFEGTVIELFRTRMTDRQRSFNAGTEKNGAKSDDPRLFPESISPSRKCCRYSSLKKHCKISLDTRSYAVFFSPQRFFPISSSFCLGSSALSVPRFTFRISWYRVGFSGRLARTRDKNSLRSFS